MDSGDIVVFLALFTLLAVAIFALWSKRKTEDRLENPSAPKSTLAADKSDHGKPADA